AIRVTRCISQLTTLRNSCWVTPDFASSRIKRSLRSSAVAPLSTACCRVIKFNTPGGLTFFPRERGSFGPANKYGNRKTEYLRIGLHAIYDDLCATIHPLFEYPAPRTAKIEGMDSAG